MSTDQGRVLVRAKANEFMGDRLPWMRELVTNLTGREPNRVAFSIDWEQEKIHIFLTNAVMIQLPPTDKMVEQAIRRLCGWKPTPSPDAMPDYLDPNLLEL